MGAPIWLQTIAGTLLHTEKVGAHTHLVVEDHARVATVYKDATHTTAATTQVAEPDSGGAIVVTDLTVSAEKINGGVVTVQWNDGSDTAVIYKGLVTDDTVNLHIGYVGRKLGWKDANIEFITSTTNQDAFVDIGFYRVSGEGVIQTFAKWDSLR